MEKSKVAVTGGAGFIGSNLVRGLLEAGYDVVVIDNLSTGFEENLAEVRDRIEFHAIDLADLAGMQAVFSSCQYVIHLAALNSVPRSIDNPLATNEADITGTLKVLVAAKDAGVKRVVYAGSSSAYGDVDVEYKSEDLPANPLAPYPVAKYTGELYAKVFYRIYGLETVTLRFFNVFGPFQNPKSEYSAVIPLFISAILRGESPKIFGDGTQARDFTHVRNNVDACIRALTADNVAGEVINIACGTNISLNDLVDLINECVGTAIPAEHLPPRKGDVLHSKASIEKANRLLGYSPLIDVKEGIKQTILWYKERM